MSLYRYALIIDYDGTDFLGWQVQPQQRTVQGEIEKNLSKVFKNFEGLVGCGRTDTGVHAKNYYAHFDLTQEIDIDLKYKLNKMLPPDIAIRSVLLVDKDFHSRFIALSRKYQYFIHGDKQVFERRTSFYYPRLHHLDFGKIKEASQLLLEFDEFLPFCKSNSDVTHMRCRMDLVQWQYDKENHKAVFTIQANRFLRGMVRLIVGMHLNVGEGKMEIEELRSALTEQKPLKLNLSVPACGLILNKIEYP